MEHYHGRFQVHTELINMNTLEQGGITYYEVNGELWRNKRNAHQAEQEVVPYQERRFIAESINQVFEPLYIEGALILLKASKTKVFVLLKRDTYQRPSPPAGWSIDERQYKPIKVVVKYGQTYTLLDDSNGQRWIKLNSAQITG